MPIIKYRNLRFTPERRYLIGKAVELINSYSAAGYTFTLRQLYYRFVALKLFPKSWRNKAGSTNTDRNYKNLGKLIGDARLAGLIDWNAIEDRTRNLRGVPTFNSPASLVRSGKRKRRQKSS